MRERKTGGIAIELPKDLLKITEVVGYINLKKYNKVFIGANDDSVYDLSFLNKLQPHAITNLQIHEKTDNYEWIHNFNALKSLVITPIKKNVIDLE